MPLKRKHTAGFTLIETIIYIALFAIIIGGGMVAAYQIIDGSDRIKIKTTVEQEADFILRKIDWALTNATSITFNAPNNITVNRPSGNIVFALNVNNFEKDDVPLNISSVKISGLLFEPVGGAGEPPGVKVTFTVSSLDGKIGQEFTMTKHTKF